MEFQREQRGMKNHQEEMNTSETIVECRRQRGRNVIAAGLQHVQTGLDQNNVTRSNPSSPLHRHSPRRYETHLGRIEARLSTRHAVPVAVPVASKQTVFRLVAVMHVTHNSYSPFSSPIPHSSTSSRCRDEYTHFGTIATQEASTRSVPHHVRARSIAGYDESNSVPPPKDNNPSANSHP